MGRPVCACHNTWPIYLDHENLERQFNTAQERKSQSSCFREKWTALGGTWTHRHSAVSTDAWLTRLPRSSAGWVQSPVTTCVHRILCYADESQCHAMLCEGLVESVARAMEAHHDDTDVQTAAIATLATALAHGTNAVDNCNCNIGSTLYEWERCFLVWCFTTRPSV